MSMYVPTFQGLDVRQLMQPRTGTRCFPFDAPHRLSFYRARNAIYHLFRVLGSMGHRLTALVPDYNSGNEVLAMRAAGATIHYYPVGYEGETDLNDVERLYRIHRPEILYVIHYLGWPQPVRELAAFCRERDILLVEDCALALLSGINEQPLGSFGDWSIFCLYKTLPVPDGALLVQNTTRLPALERLSLRRPGVASVAGRTAELLVQRLRGRADGVGAVLQAIKQRMGQGATALDVRRSPIGDMGFTLADVDLAMSAVSSHLLSRLEFRSIRDARVTNYRVIAERLRGRASLFRSDLPHGVCPLFLPILVQDKHATAEALRRRGIGALEFWNEGADSSEEGPPARLLRRHLLAVPVHQDLTSAQLSFIARELTNLDLRVAA